MGGKSEISVRLEDEPGAVSGSKWLRAETRQHATKFFRSGEFQKPRRSLLDDVCTRSLSSANQANGGQPPFVHVLRIF